MLVPVSRYVFCDFSFQSFLHLIIFFGLDCSLVHGSLISFKTNIVLYCAQIMDNYAHAWDMSVFRYVFRELRIRQGLQRRVVVLRVHSNFYSRWYIASAIVHQVLGHRSYSLAEDYLGPSVFVAVRSDADVQTLLSYRYEFRGVDVFSHRIRYLTLRPHDPEIGGVRAVALN